MTKVTKYKELTMTLKELDGGEYRLYFQHPLMLGEPYRSLTDVEQVNTLSQLLKNPVLNYQQYMEILDYLGTIFSEEELNEILEIIPEQNLGELSAEEQAAFEIKRSAHEEAKRQQAQSLQETKELFPHLRQQSLFKDQTSKKGSTDDEKTRTLDLDGALGKSNQGPTKFTPASGVMASSNNQATSALQESVFKSLQQIQDKYSDLSSTEITSKVMPLMTTFSFTTMETRKKFIEIAEQEGIQLPTSLKKDDVKPITVRNQEFEKWLSRNIDRGFQP